MSTLSVRHGWIIRQHDTVVCTCALPNPRHTSGTQCFAREQVAAFMAAHGLTNEGHARALMYVESFGPKQASPDSVKS